MTDTSSFSPPFSVSEWIKFRLVPASLYSRYLVDKNMKRGEAELRVLADIVPAGRIAVDVGASKGVYARVLSGLASHVHAFEPNPKSFRWLDRALPGNVTTHPVALSDRDGEAELFLPQRGRRFSGSGGSLNPRKARSPHGTVRVATRTLGIGCRRPGKTTSTISFFCRPDSGSKRFRAGPVCSCRPGLPDYRAAILSGSLRCDVLIF